MPKYEYASDINDCGQCGEESVLCQQCEICGEYFCTHNCYEEHVKVCEEQTFNNMLTDAEKGTNDGDSSTITNSGCSI